MLGVSQVSSFSTGILLTVVRSFEPYFMFLVKKRFYELFGKLIKKEKRLKNKLYTNTLNSFLTSSLNIELVNIILQSIVSFNQKSFEHHIENNEISLE